MELKHYSNIDELARDCGIFKYFREKPDDCEEFQEGVVLEHYPTGTRVIVAHYATPELNREAALRALYAMLEAM